jgi:hypothetical protein
MPPRLFIDDVPDGFTRYPEPTAKLCITEAFSAGEKPDHEHLICGELGCAIALTVWGRQTISYMMKVNAPSANPSATRLTRGRRSPIKAAIKKHTKAKIHRIRSNIPS